MGGCTCRRRPRRWRRQGAACLQPEREHPVQRRRLHVDSETGVRRPGRTVHVRAVHALARATAPETARRWNTHVAVLPPDRQCVHAALRWMAARLPRRTWRDVRRTTASSLRSADQLAAGVAARQDPRSKGEEVTAVSAAAPAPDDDRIPTIIRALINVMPLPAIEDVLDALRRRLYAVQSAQAWRASELGLLRGLLIDADRGL